MRDLQGLGTTGVTAHNVEAGGWLYVRGSNLGTL